MAPPATSPAPELTTLISLLRDAQRIIVFTGSVSPITPLTMFGLGRRSGPPNWHDLQAIPQARGDHWKHMKEQWLSICEQEPTPLHHAIAELYQMKKLTAAFTSCIDGLLPAAGIPADHLVELHGSIHRVDCLRCRRSVEAHTIYPKVRSGGGLIPNSAAGLRLPRCFNCNGELMPGANASGQMIRPDRLSAAHNAMNRCDLFIAVGTDLKENPAANLCLHTYAMDIPYVIVHDGGTHHDGYIKDGMVAHRLQLDAEEYFPKAVAALREPA